MQLNGEFPVIVARAARLLGLGVLVSLLTAAGPAAALALLAALVVAALASGGPDVTVILHLPRWVFRALTVPVTPEADASTLARAWWVQQES